MDEIEQERMQLVSYDPFPLMPNKQRIVEDFLFEITKDKKIYTNKYYGTRSTEGYFFKIKHLKTAEMRTIYISDSRYQEKEIDVLKLIMLNRKKLSINKLLWALNKTEKFQRGGAIASETRDFNTSQHLKRACYRTYYSLKNRFDRVDYTNLDLTDNFISELKNTIETDKENWKKLKKQNSKLDTNSDLEDLIRTNELLNLLPMFKTLQTKLEHFNSSGLNYSLQELNELEKAFDKIKYHSYLFVTLKKLCNKK